MPATPSALTPFARLPQVYISPPARQDFFSKIDAANVDLKAFNDQFYFKLTGSRLQPVLDTLVYIKHENETYGWKITTLFNSGATTISSSEITDLSQWIFNNLGADVPLHFSAFHPDHKMRDTYPTPIATLIRARDIARKAGLHYVFTGNVHYSPGDTSYCPQCRSQLIVRDWYEIKQYRLDHEGQCPTCGFSIAGKFAANAGNFGRRRLPIQIAQTDLQNAK